MPTHPSRVAPAAPPPPDRAALHHSQAVLHHIRGAIEQAGGWISFARYMELVLYAPGLGYYASGTAKFGAGGDFITAPEISPLFGHTLAGVAADVLQQTGGEILELGAGSGRLAADMLLGLQRLDCLPTRYLILEPSPDLRARQAAHLTAHAAHLVGRVHWLDSLPARIDGLVLGNEVLDALPVHLLHWRAQGVYERGVTWAESGLAWADRPIASPALAQAAARLPVPAPYLSELNLAAPALVASLAERLRRGMLLFIDYGFDSAQYYHPQRRMGTLKVHYRHHSLDDPFYLPGLADITAHVDFTAVARAAEQAGLTLARYASQGRFLLDAGLLQHLSALPLGSPAYLRAAQAVQKLVQPHEMGELFKVMALLRDVHAPRGCTSGHGP